MGNSLVLAAGLFDGLGGMVLPFIMIGFLFYFLLIRPEKRKQQNHRTMLENLKKNDKVVTIGGIWGTVTNIQREVDEVTLRIDESSGAKLRVKISAIADVVNDKKDKKEQKDDSAKMAEKS